MVAGKGPNGGNPPQSYSLVCQELFDSGHDINLQNKRDRTTNDVLVQFIDRVLSVIWSRRLAKTVKHERLALLPAGTKREDVICILYGCSVPVVLRNTKDKTTEGEDVWELIGECYVYEMMAGEALFERRIGHEEEIAKRKEERREDQFENQGDDENDPNFFYKNRRKFKIR